MFTQTSHTKRGDGNANSSPRREAGGLLGATVEGSRSRGKFLFVLVLSCLVQKHYLRGYGNTIAVGECKLINTLSLIDESIEALRIL
jgi:hypothetical protein